MIGIYKITNLLNNKVYIGQSNNIERRFKEHCTKWRSSRIPVDWDIHYLGKENFSFEILEECSLNELNDKETYWIDFFNSIEAGYNQNRGGDTLLAGELNPNAKLTEEDVKQIRLAYSEHKSQKEVYNQIAVNKIAWSTFQNIWQGKSWTHIMPEVFTKENKDYYSKQATNGEKSTKAVLSDEEVLKIRQRYVNETAKQIYVDYENLISFQTLQQILWGRHYKHLPIYSKKHKQWIS